MCQASLSARRIVTAAPLSKSLLPQHLAAAATVVSNPVTTPSNEPDFSPVGRFHRTVRMASTVPARVQCPTGGRARRVDLDIA
ncbi:protein of unknown function (plasmid) [Cupriavidus taiwanensis]|uniref:Uncharacterized protein n=1 Tax=Cupriavidus taiwanensis TaxID=164546 RepID=A0A7Z7JFW0_9BURK|nr:protein of unknown function [Cupriavidus taiwanensis]SPC23134.1 protein of unknown function [Cupriavidus taiwanensis]SPD54647.1 protein of unknown function [Cupriavidus taiwanensis]